MNLRGHFLTHPRCKTFTRHLLRMKFAAFSLLCFCMQTSATGFSQTITLSEKNVSLKTVLKEINRQTGYRFFYEDALLNNAGGISVDLRNTPLADALKACLKDLPLTYAISKNRIMITATASEGRDSTAATARLAVDVTGMVVGEDGTPLPGATVKLKGTSKGVTTDAIGHFSIQVPRAGVVLTVSFIGYEPLEVIVQAAGPMRIVLKRQQSKVEEVVVVAHGKQKKTEVVGAVTSIKPAELKIPSSNLTNALAGKLAGVIAFQRSGEPGFDNADFFVRGVTTFGYRKSPLILIDNIQASTTDLARLQVDDIASFSIMKDATATALYGSKGANGVILITTKEGKEGSANLSFRAETSMSRSTRNVQLADPVTYMELANEAVLTRNPLGGLLYSKDKIENTRNGIDPVVFPATDWQQMLLRNAAINQRYNLSVNGGGKIARYYVSGAMNMDNGILKTDRKSNFNSNSKLKSYSIRSNVNVNLTPSTEMIVRISGSFDDYSGPIKGGEEIYKQIMQSNPVLFPAYYEPTEETKYVRHIMFGNAADGKYNNPYADLQKGYRQFNRSAINAQLALNQKLSFITEGLSVRGLLNIQRNAYFSVSRAYSPFFYVAYNYDYVSKGYSLKAINQEAGQSEAPAGTEYLNYTEGDKTLSSDFYGELAVDYRRTFNKVHGLSGTLVGIAKNSLTGNAGSLQNSLPFRNLGLSGRATYLYDNRYAVEFNFGYNGSERFYKTHRFGFFPSAGIAYTVSNEAYWERWKRVVSKLKLRATYGLVGNDAIGSPDDRFFYLSNVDMNSSKRGMSFGTLKNYNLSGVDISRYANFDITWEKAAKTNVGFEASFFDRLNLEVDVYTEKRSNILMPRSSIPTTMGLSAGLSANVGKASARGVDLAMDYTHQITHQWWAKAMANFTYATSRFEVYEEPAYPEKNKSHLGHSLSQQWGYIAERLFVDDLDAKNSPKQSFGVYGGGDIKYRDVNGDGQITEMDMCPIGFPTTPEIVYGFGLSSGYDRFDFNIFFQGLARESFWIDAEATSPFIKDQRQLLKVWADNHWSEDNQNIYALWPRLSTSAIDNNNQPSTWFMRNGALLRIKSVEIGYTLTATLMKRLRLANARLYLNGTNLFTFSKFNLWDVEMGGNGLGYPIQRIFNAGVTCSFK
ncbi:TonB-dependent receptor [Chitinophaga oryzae]|uniref:TonB-dependent receptor n=1 Tax=Chitinophaga oryzae TaxID=2725414 RepID=A0AAE7D819_9BACT|nr:TonB-dependent receptor [Chitinophaga oryzae]QJB32294.1 TonB-dependent receptor [Chitinophaga oryzae]